MCKLPAAAAAITIALSIYTPAEIIEGEFSINKNILTLTITNHTNNDITIGTPYFAAASNVAIDIKHPQYKERLNPMGSSIHPGYTLIPRAHKKNFKIIESPTINTQTQLPEFLFRLELKNGKHESNTLIYGIKPSELFRVRKTNQEIVTLQPFPNKPTD